MSMDEEGAGAICIRDLSRRSIGMHYSIYLYSLMCKSRIRDHSFFET